MVRQGHGDGTGVVCVRHGHGDGSDMARVWNGHRGGTSKGRVCRANPRGGVWRATRRARVCHPAPGTVLQARVTSARSGLAPPRRPPVSPHPRRRIASRVHPPTPASNGALNQKLQKKTKNAAPHHRPPHAETRCVAPQQRRACARATTHETGTCVKKNRCVHLLFQAQFKAHHVAEPPLPRLVHRLPP